MNDEQTAAHEQHEVKELKHRLAQETNHRALCESLFAEALREGYLDLEKCPPTWIAEAHLATTR
jgi:hypothetical protein